MDIVRCCKYHNIYHTANTGHALHGLIKNREQSIGNKCIQRKLIFIL